MSTTILEALENAKINFETVGKMGADRNLIFRIGIEQLSNAIAALNADMSPHDVLQDGMFEELNINKADK